MKDTEPGIFLLSMCSTIKLDSPPPVFFFHLVLYQKVERAFSMAPVPIHCPCWMSCKWFLQCGILPIVQGKKIVTFPIVFASHFWLAIASLLSPPPTPGMSSCSHAPSNWSSGFLISLPQSGRTISHASIHCRQGKCVSSQRQGRRCLL